MYTRGDYPSTEESMHIPQNYGGNALANAPPEEADEQQDTTTERSPCNDPEAQACEASCKPKHREPFSFASILGKLPFLGQLGELPFLKREDANTKKGLSLDTEDLLLIGLAGFLLFSKDGDTLCALLLLGLVFFT